MGMRNILVQSAFQLILSLTLLFAGPQLFDVRSGEWCSSYSVKGSDDTELYKNENNGQMYNVSCKSFKDDCGSSDNGDCYLDKYWHDLKGFNDDCLTCEKLDWTHGTIIFNTFVFCQVFNEYNSRSIHSDVDVFSGVVSNMIFIGVSVVTVALQLMLVEVGGEFIQTTPLTLNQWLWTILFGFLSVPVGILMRFIPVEEDPNSFSTPMVDKAKDPKRNSQNGADVEMVNPM